VVTDPKVIKGQSPLDFAVDGLDVLTSLRAAGDVWLVAHGDERVTGATQSMKRRRSVLRDLEILDRPGREWTATPDHGPVQNAIAVEKNRVAAPIG